MVFRAEYIKRLCLGSCLLAIVSIASAQVKPDDILFYSKSASALKKQRQQGLQRWRFPFGPIVLRSAKSKKTNGKIPTPTC
jgi:hypothetical protein